jgi:transposase
MFARAGLLRAVSMDMTGGYAKSVGEHAPQAIRCIDPYHVVQLANQALDEVRRDYWNELRRSGDQQAAKRFKEDTTQDPPRWLAGDRADRAGASSVGGPLA